MEDWRTFIFPAVGLFWIFDGVRQLLWPRRRRKPQAEAASAGASPGGAGAVVSTAARRPWVSSLLWLSLGFAALWISDSHIAAAPTITPPSPTSRGTLEHLITREVLRDLEERSHVGLVVGAVCKDEEAILGFGLRQLGDSQPPDADTVFEIGSISKTFTGILLARLIERGQVKLDDRVAHLLPEGWSLAEAAQHVTLRHCTTHTSGFPRLPANLLSFSKSMRNLAGGDPYRDYTEERFREALAALELDYKPGAGREYSNFAVGLLGYLLAVREGTDYETLLKTEICQPLGMDKTVITNTAWHDERFATGYRGSMKLGPALIALGSSQWLLPNHLTGAGGIRSTGRDMMRYLKANMGQLETPLDAAIRQSHQELHQEQPDRAMGMNWIRSHVRPVGQTVVWHNGGTGGFRCYLGFTEDGQAGVFVLSNSSKSVDELGEEIIEELVELASEEAGQSP